MSPTEKQAQLPHHKLIAYQLESAPAPETEPLPEPALARGLLSGSRLRTRQRRLPRRAGRGTYPLMARTPSNMRELGTPIPRFDLPDTVSGRSVSSDSLLGKPAVVIFICNHCPYVKHIRDGLAAFGRFCQERGAAMVAISSNDAVAYPEDGPEQMALEAKQAGYVFPYLYDESQSVARAFEAACTPDLYVYDAQGKLAYRGQFDDARPKNDAPVTGKDARAAVEALLAGRAPAAEQQPSIGCNIKWKS